MSTNIIYDNNSYFIILKTISNAGAPTTWVANNSSNLKEYYILWVENKVIHNLNAQCVMFSYCGMFFVSNISFV